MIGGTRPFVEIDLGAYPVHGTSFVDRPRRFALLGPGRVEPTSRATTISEHVTGDSVASERIDIADEQPVSSPCALTVIRHDGARIVRARQRLLVRVEHEYAHASPWSDALEFEARGDESVFGGAAHVIEIAISGAHVELRPSPLLWSKATDTAFAAIRSTLPLNATPASVEAALATDGDLTFVRSWFDDSTRAASPHLDVLVHQRVIAHIHGVLSAIL